MTYALSWSGGKDSTLALDRAVREGYDIGILLNIYEGSSGRVRFHGVRRELIRAQADALGLELAQPHTHPADYEAVFLDALDALAERGVEGMIFGNIHLEDIRGWYEERTTARGLEHIEPLWGGAPGDRLREFVRSGYRARVVSIDLERGDADWLGRELDAELAGELERASDVDPAGERGEYHTFVWDGPLFRRPVRVRSAETVEMEGHRLLELVPAE